MSQLIAIPTYPAPKKEEVAVKQTAVEKSLARPNPFSKPASISQPNTRLRLLGTKPKSGKQRRRKHDPRDVRFY